MRCRADLKNNYNIMFDESITQVISTLMKEQETIIQKHYEIWCKLNFFLCNNSANHKLYQSSKGKHSESVQRRVHNNAATPFCVL